MSEDKLIHKETFFEPSYDGIISHWVVRYWYENPNGFCESQYFSTEKDAKEFESSLIQFDDWVTSQEIPLATQ